MKATKYTITITVEVLSMEAAPAIISQTANAIEGSMPEGSLTYDDGDAVSWKTESKNVEF